MRDQLNQLRGEWVIKFNGLFGTADIGAHVVLTSHVITTYTLESLSFLTQITYNIQATINFKKKDIKKNPLSWSVIGDTNTPSVYNDSKHLTSSLTEIEPHTAITNQPEESKEKK